MNRAERYRSLIEKLRKRKLRFVLAESCTGGLAAARLTGISGASEVFCGSMVTYRESVKTEWLGVSEDILSQHSAVSTEVTLAMARAVLKATPEASLAAAITGHLGPDAPEELDGILFAAILCRESQALNSRSVPSPQPIQYRLQETGRAARQQEAADFLLNLIEESLD